MELQIAEYIAAHRSTELTALMQAITSLGSNFALLIIFSAAIFYSLFKFKRLNEIILIGLSLGIGQLTALFLKDIFLKPRPPISLAVYAEKDFAMPSGHALLAAGFYGMLFYQFGINIKNKIIRRIYWFCSLIFVLMLGFSRIYLGVHWVSDVLVGFLLGVILNFILIKISPSLFHHKSLKVKP